MRSSWYHFFNQHSIYVPHHRWYEHEPTGDPLKYMSKLIPHPSCYANVLILANTLLKRHGLENRGDWVYAAIVLANAACIRSQTAKYINPIWYRRVTYTINKCVELNKPERVEVVIRRMRKRASGQLIVNIGVVKRYGQHIFKDGEIIPI